MSVFKVLEQNINKRAEDFSEYLSSFKGDLLKGAEFMFYSLSNIFADKTIDEIEEGIVDSSYRKEKYDYGIDAIYITGSGDFIEHIEQLEEYNDDTKFIIHIFQFKRGKGIDQADLLKFNNGIEKVIVKEDLSEDDNLYFFNRMIELNEIKTQIFQNFTTDNITIIPHIVFGGLERNILEDKLLNEELEKINNTLQNGGFINSQIKITDCQKLINPTSRRNEIIDIVEYEKTFKYITKTEEGEKLNGYISIIKGKEIAELVKKYQTSLFEANIRDYYKRSTLNSKITETSASKDEAKYFWSFNNGITITCNKVEELPKDKYRLYNLQIVNGCQTSNAIYAAYKNKQRVEELTSKKQQGNELTKKEIDELQKKERLVFNDETTLLVKIIETNNEELIYRITETTNSQTPIKAFSLKANDDVQLLIEQYLENKGIWYERRLNYYKNKGKKNVVNIQKLFQLFTSQILYKPSQVKTRPKAMFIETYDDVFPSPSVTTMNFVLYFIPIKVDFYISKKVREIQRNNTISDNYKKTILSYGKFHLGCFVLSSILKNKYNKKGIIDNETLIIGELENNFDKHFNDALVNFEKLLKNFIGNRKEAIITGVRKTELDNKIAKFVNNRK